MNKKTWWDIIDQTIEKVGTPLSPEEIWNKANELGITKDFFTTGKTPWNTIAAYCYTAIKNNPDSSVVRQISKIPAKFFLRRLIRDEEHLDSIRDEEETVIAKKEEKEIREIKEAEKFHERDLHPLLVSFAKSNINFKANLKTIFHEGSIKTEKGKNKWLHPDIVGAYFPFQDYESEVINIQDATKVSSVKIFSFELKTKLNFTNLRESYFQAVSNSSWANEGYLVSANINEDEFFRSELSRLSKAFGVGVIHLNIENVFESEVLFPAKEKQFMNWDTVDRLASENDDFRNFLKFVVEDIKLGKVKSEYDKVLNPEELDEYVKNKNIKSL